MYSSGGGGGGGGTGPKIGIYINKYTYQPEKFNQFLL